jgi:hypothetical protein
MSMIDAFAKTSIAWEVASKTASNTFFKPSYAAATNILARVEHEVKEIISSQSGAKVISNTQIYFNPTYDIQPNDRITISGITKALIVVNVATQNMFNVNDHKQAFLI